MVTGAGAEFRILGPLEVRISGQEPPIRGGKHGTVLALLLLAWGGPVPVSRLIDAVWDDKAPRTATKQIRNIVSDLRQALAAANAEITLATGGYRLRVASDALDAVAFTRRVELGREHACAGRIADAIADFRAALSLWRGPALAGLDHLAHHPQVVELNEQRLAVLEESVDLELAQGRHRRLARELPVWLAEHPTHERLACQLMIALTCSGVPARALGVYEQTRRTLERELGVGPGPEMRELRRLIMDGSRNLPSSSASPGRGRLAARQRAASRQPRRPRRVVRTRRPADGAVHVRDRMA